MKKLSVILATRNQEENIGDCLKSVKNIADEIVVVDEYSSDRTVEIAKRYGARVFKEPHHEIFHITKQKALEKATGDWILQLDPDERVSQPLAKEIKEVINLTTEEIKKRRIEDERKWKLFQRHQRLIEERDGGIGKKTGEIVAFFIPRRNYFLGKPLVHAGVYPDGVIRLVKKGRAHFPAKSVHEQIAVDGEVYWLFNDIIHHDSPTLKRYFIRLNRYTNLHAQELIEKKVGKDPWNLFKYTFLLPTYYFFLRYIRHKGFMDGVRGFLWSFFSALHYPVAYFKYWSGKLK